MAAKMAFFMAFLVCLCRPVIAQTAGVSGSVIEGDVVDGATGQGIPGARVKLGSEQDAPRFTFTDDAGHFQFTGPSGKSYWIAAQQIGFMSPDDGPWNYGRTRPIQPGQTQPVRIELIRYAAIAGTVTDSSGAPVPVSYITVMRKMPPGANQPGIIGRRMADGKNPLEQAAQAFTGQRGIYRVARLRPGTYYVLAQPLHGGLLSTLDQTERDTYYGGAVEFDKAKPVEAAAGRTIDSVDIQILRATGVRVSGQIEKPKSQEGSASRADVSTSVALQADSEGFGYTRPLHGDVNGDRFEIKDVPPGKYMLTVDTRETQDRPEDQKELTAAIQTIEVGQTDLSGLIVRPQPPHDLAGVVRFDGGCGPCITHLWGRPLTGMSTFVAAVNTDGSFVLKNLLPSRYLLAAMIQGDPFARVGAIRLGGRESQNAFLLSGEEHGPLLVDIVCPRASVSGEVVDASGAPVPGAMVALVSPSLPGLNQSANTSREGGRFEITVRPGIYDLYVCSAPNRDPSHSTACQKTGGPLSVKEGTNPRLVLKLPAAGRKEGSP